MQRRKCRIMIATAIAGMFAFAQPALALDRRFTIAVIPDTQNYLDYANQKSAGFPFDAKTMFIDQMKFIAKNVESAGGEIAFVTAAGDIWQHSSLDMDPAHAARGFTFTKVTGPRAKLLGPKAETRSFEMPAAAEGYDLIAGKVPFSVVPGNHDYDALWVNPKKPRPGDKSTRIYDYHVGGLSNFNAVFGSRSRYFKGKPWYVASHDGGADSAQIFTAGGYRFLHIGLQLDPPDATLQWAAVVLARYRGLPTIVTLHNWMNKEKERVPPTDVDSHLVDPQDNNSEMVWQKLVSRHPQIFMVLAGHQCGQALRVDRNRAGREVYQLLSDYQCRGQTAKEVGLTIGQLLGIGDGWMRLMEFDMAAKVPTVRVRTYSTHYKAFSNELPTYAAWYKAEEKPLMSDEAFNAEDDFTVSLNDFRARFDKRPQLRSVARR